MADPSTARAGGFENYRSVLANPLFWKALGNTFYFVLVAGPLSVGVSLGAALLVHARATRLRGLFRTIYFVPVVTTLVAVAIVFRYLEHPKYGLVNYALGLVGVPPVDWLGDPRFAMPAIVPLAVWENFGHKLLIFVAGDTITAQDLGFLGRDGVPEALAQSGPVVPLSDARDEFEKDYILQTLAAQQGNMSRTAEVLGVERSNLYKKLRAFGITPRGVS